MEAVRDSKVVKLEVFHALRAKLAEAETPPPPTQTTVRTGIEQLDATAGGLPRGTVTEFSGSLAHGGLFFSALLAVCGRERWHMALIDAADQFEPVAWSGEALRRLLLIRCRDARKALHAADLLLRDGNLPMLVLDLQGSPAKQLRRIPPNVWHRFQRVIEESRVSLVVLTRTPMVEGARLRIEADGRMGLESMYALRSDLAAQMPVRVRRRTASWNAKQRMA